MAGGRMADGNGSGDELDVVVVGAGFAGLYMLHRLRQLGFSATVLESADDVGGTWYWNRYPGARCDIPTIDYTYRFDPELETEWTWSEKYATQPEILRYLQHVADKHDLRRDIQFSTRVDVGDVGRRRVAAGTITTDHGDDCHVPLLRDGHRLPVAAEGRRHRRRRALRRRGVLHEPLAARGRRLHRQAGRRHRHRVVGHPVDPAHRRAGRGARRCSSARRTSRSRPTTARPPAGALDAIAARSRRPTARRPSGHAVASRASRRRDRGAQLSAEEQRARFEEAWEAGELFAILGVVRRRADQPRRQRRSSPSSSASKIRVDRRRPGDGRDAVPHRPPVRHQAAVPRHQLLRHVQPAARPARRSAQAPDHDDHRDRHRHRSTSRSSSTRSCFATGFDAMTGAIVAVDITGRDGVTLKDKWAHGPTTYLGLTTVGFPNLFIITGPGSPSVLSNMTVSIEQHVDWVADCLDRPARPRASTRSSRPRPPRPAGCSTSTTAPTSRCTRRPTRGTWAPTCPASRGCSCRTSAASTRTARRATRWSSATTSASRSPARTARSCNDGVIRRVQPDVALVLEMMAELGPAAARVDVGRRRSRVHGRDRRAMRPPGPDVGEIVDGVLPGAGGRPRRTASTDRRRDGPAPDRRLLPRRRLGARQPRRPTIRSAATCASAPTRSSCRSTTATRRRHASRPPPTTGSPPCSGSPTTPRSSAASPASSPSPAGAPAPTSPRSSASWRATPAGRTSSVRCC